ncbi:MAG: TfoX/Sxy family protein [Pseudomonadota bacterium]|nr:TfoX/Sxy family protein [Pseudomonadota bacterium]
MAVNPEFRAFVAELLEPVGRVEIRRMFGGLGIFRDGLMFGLVADETLFLKADDLTRAEFEALGSKPFTYGRKDGRRASLNYMELPETLYDEPDAVIAWARKAIDAAHRKEAAKRKPRRKTTAE